MTSHFLRRTTWPHRRHRGKEIGQGRLVIIGDQNCVEAYSSTTPTIEDSGYKPPYGRAINPTLPLTANCFCKGSPAKKNARSYGANEPLAQRKYQWGTDLDEGLTAFEFLNKHADARATDRFLEDAEWLLLQQQNCYVIHKLAKA